MERHKLSINVLRIAGKRGNPGTILIPLPAELWQPIGACSCSDCVKRGAEVSYLDTLAIGDSAPGERCNDYTWLVHYPDRQPAAAHKRRAEMESAQAATAATE